MKFREYVNEMRDKLIVKDKGKEYRDGDEIEYIRKGRKSERVAKGTVVGGGGNFYRVDTHSGEIVTVLKEMTAYATYFRLEPKNDKDMKKVIDILKKHKTSFEVTEEGIEVGVEASSIIAGNIRDDLKKQKIEA